jgi:D-alanyl-D-alanine carboxypeptidase (penicillin-binding protein 5/6)
MRPPADWHIRQRPGNRGRGRLRLIAAIAIATVAGVFLLQAHVFQDRSSATAPAQSNAACVDADCLLQPEGESDSDALGAGAESAQPEQLPAVTYDAPPPDITGRAAAVIEASCGTLIYGRNPHAHLRPASLTKIATALVANERTRPGDVVDIEVNSALLSQSTGSTVMGLEPGMKLTMNDLLYGLLLASGNDAAIAIAQHVGGSVPEFVKLMNGKVASLGLRNTHFANPHGLDEPGLYTSAFDIAMLGRALLERRVLADIVRTQTYQPNWDGPAVWNGNELLTTYPGTVGIKIGYTEGAGQTIVAAADFQGRRLIVSVLSSWDRYSDAIALFEWAFAHTKPACAA